MRVSTLLTVPLLAFATTATAQNLNSIINGAESIINGLPLSSLAADITGHPGALSSLAAEASSFVSAHKSELDSIYSRYGTGIPASLSSVIAQITDGLPSAGTGTGTGSGSGSGGNGGSGGSAPAPAGGAAGALQVPSLALSLMGAAAVGVFGAAVAL